MNTWTYIISHHLGYEGEVCGSAVRQKGTVVMSRPWASVHPQHGADSRGGRWWAHAALGGSFPGRARPLASVHLMGGAEELGIPQLRQRHVRSTRAVNLSQSHKSEKKKDDAGKKRKERRNPQKRTAKAGQLKKQNKTGWPPLKKRRICQPSLPPSCVSGAVWHFRVRSWCVCLAAGASGCGAEWLIGSLLKHQAPPMPGAGD